MNVASGEPAASPDGAGERPLRGAGARLVAVACAALAFAVFAPGLFCGFVALDDPASDGRYGAVVAGLSAEGWRLAWAADYFGHWVPLTVLSVMLDWELWGDRAMGHHLTNQLLHALVAALVFLFLRRATGCTGRAAAVAALFAVHPLRVEPVLWLTGRKDLLSAAGSLAALWLYVRWREAPGARRYAAVALALVAALLAKATAVVVPVLMLLLDFWPLRRLGGAAATDPAGSGPPGRPRVWLTIFAEKLPFLALAAAAGLGALAAASSTDALSALDTLPVSQRVASALGVYARSLRQTFWPTGLAVFYPLEEPTGGELAGAAALLLVPTLAALALARRAPWVAVGWLWWVACILPVSGLLQAGGQSGADRYTYLASVGLLVALVWSAAELAGAAGRWPGWRRLLAPAAGLAVVVLSLLTWRLIPAWRDTGSLYAHAIEATGDNYFAELNLGGWLLSRGQPEAALPHLRRATEGRGGGLPLGWTSLGRALRELRRHEEAAAALQVAIRIAPEHRPAHLEMAAVLEEQGRAGPAAGHLAFLVALEPRDAAAWQGLAAVVRGPGAAREALPYVRAVARERPSAAVDELVAALARAAAGPAGAAPAAEPPAAAPPTAPATPAPGRR